MNHYQGIADKPNLECVTCLWDGWPLIFYRSTKPISKDDELVVDYGKGYWEEMMEAEKIVSDQEIANRKLIDSIVSGRGLES